MGRTFRHSLFWAALLLFAATRGIQAATPRSTVVTIAGDGSNGYASGDALTSHFVMPVGVFVAPDQSTLITDAGANIIYRLRNGKIERVAGALGTLENDIGDRGGYRDGPALNALFERPSAALQRLDGGIYVADTGNHRIRLITHGEVEPYAGTGEQGTSDGTVKTATFKNPIGMVLDADGNLLVVDYSVGIRKIAPDGTVTTLPYGGPDKKVLGIAAGLFNGHKLIAYTEIHSTHLVVDGKDTELKSDDERMPTHEGVPVFSGWGIAIMNENTVVVADPMTSVMRLIRFPSLPFTDRPASEALSGTLHEDTDFHGGFRDGTNSEALYTAPRAIAADTHGGLVIADTGNRRIRRMSGFDVRESILPDFSNFAAEAGRTNVVLVGQSQLFNGILYPDSIAANAEATFDSAFAEGKLHRRVHVQAVRADGIEFKTMVDITNQYLIDRGTVDAVVFFLNSGTYAELEPLVAETNELAAYHIRTVVVLTPGWVEQSILELPYNTCACTLPIDTIELFRHSYTTLESAYKNAGIQTISLVDSMNAVDLQTNRQPLFDMNDTHFTPAGQRVIGRLLAGAMLADTKWLNAAVPALTPVDDVQTETCPAEVVEAMPVGQGFLTSVSTPNMSQLDSGAVIKTDELPTIIGWQSTLRGEKQILCMTIDGYTGAAAQVLNHQISFDATWGMKQLSQATSGYRLTLKQPLTPGKHIIGIAVIGPDGKPHLQSRTFLVDAQ